MVSTGNRIDPRLNSPRRRALPLAFSTVGLARKTKEPKMKTSITTRSTISPAKPAPAPSIKRVSADDMPKTPDDFAKVFRQLALSFQDFETHTAGRTPESRSVSSDALHGAAGEILNGAVAAGLLGRYPGLPPLAAFHFGTASHPGKVPPNYVRCSWNFLAEARIEIQAERAEYFLGKSAADGPRYSAIFSVLVDEICAARADTNKSGKPVELNESTLTLRHGDKQEQILLSDSQLLAVAPLVKATPARLSLSTWRDRSDKQEPDKILKGLAGKHPLLNRFFQTPNGVKNAGYGLIPPEK